ncbi:Holliday junction branch migration protein RuvA [Caldibacillus lycopersici]|uniref:Holliday junction branch migration complex subunit RuvA n=1 Tax=Perspicuibacillus lycopersici TaxID=1325689 RepID=A0AAE3IT71_9BACI|nr:Holliday junction branch migration protein RuvA [Perspicuibacillus lycopersici]MCU9613996.1 Holliday junction branch migration protein RuvA [Perspicuibacillus lycopersici]
MYEYIVGTIKYISPQYIVIENNSIGYQLLTPNPYAFSMDGKELKVYTYFHIREDAHTLYGFVTREEKQFFTKLLNVSGIGPKGALAILAAGEPQKIAQAIEQENENFLTKFPGVGKKTARQIILDLKGKLQDFLGETGEDLPVDMVTLAENIEVTEALLALEALGYSQKEINRVAPLLEKEKLTTDQYIKLALKKLTSL